VNVVDLDVLVREVIAEFVARAGSDVDATTLPGDCDLLESALIDSTTFLELVAALEERLGAEIDLLEVDTAGMTTLDGLVKTLGRLRL